MRRAPLRSLAHTARARAAGDSTSASRALIVVETDDFYRRIALRADLGLAEAYMHADFTTPEMRDILLVLSLNRHRVVTAGISQRLFQGLSTAVLGSAMAYWQHLAQHNKAGNRAASHEARAPAQPVRGAPPTRDRIARGGRWATRTPTSATTTT